MKKLGTIYLTPYDHQMDLGACCACEATGATVRNIIMLDKRAPVSGTGWGCVQCRLPFDGAVYVLCDECLDAKREPKDVCRGYPGEGARVSIATVTEPFEHDMSKHPE